MSDDDYKAVEEKLRSQAADAFRFVRSDAAKSPAFERFEITPEQSEAVDRAKQDLEERAKNRFR